MTLLLSLVFGFFGIVTAVLSGGYWERMRRTGLILLFVSFALFFAAIRPYVQNFVLEILLAGFCAIVIASECIDRKEKKKK